MAGLDVNTLLLLHGYSFEDSSFYKHSISNNGVVTSSKKSKFGGKSLYFDGNSLLTVDLPYSPSDNYFTKEFTVDFWINLDRYTQYGTPVSWLTSDNNRGTYWHLTSGGSSFVYGEEVKPYPKVPLNEWHHMAVVNEKGYLSLFYDGIPTDGLSIYSRNDLNKFVIGALVPSGEAGTRIVGYIDELRVSDVARWTKPFIPPNAPYSSNKPVSVPFDSKPQKTFYARVYPLTANGYAQSEIETQTNSLKTPIYDEIVPISNLPEGTIVQIETGTNEESSFVVAKHNYEAVWNGDGRTLLVAQYAFGNYPWNKNGINTYKDSDLDKRLNLTWYNSLPQYVKRKILLTRIEYTPGNGDYSAKRISRNVFQLSGTEMGFHVGNMNNEGNPLPIAALLKPAKDKEGRAVNQHLRSPTTNNPNTVWRLNSDGSLYYPSANQNAADRPCFTVSKDTVFSKSGDAVYKLIKTGE